MSRLQRRGGPRGNCYEGLGRPRECTPGTELRLHLEDMYRLAVGLGQGGVGLPGVRLAGEPTHLARPPAFAVRSLSIGVVGRFVMWVARYHW